MPGLNARDRSKNAVGRLSRHDGNQLFRRLTLYPSLRAGDAETASGCIMNVSSVAGRMSCSPMAPYAASKFALEAASEALAQEGKPFNIRVLIVEPGIIATPMAQRIADADKESPYPQIQRFSRMFEASLARSHASPRWWRKKFWKFFKPTHGNSASLRSNGAAIS